MTKELSMTKRVFNGLLMAKIIGLTGPIGAGKNEVAKLLVKQGYEIIDADEVAHTLYIPQSDVWKKLVKSFGSKILNRGGEVNRKKLGEIVFADEGKLAELNRIVQPYLEKQLTKELKNGRTGVPVVINAALPQLFEGLADQVWVVTAKKKVRLSRLVKAGLKKELAEQRMAAQMADQEYIKLADVVIENNGTLKELHAQVQNLLKV